jgi:two-component system chemotaxis response regulator CheY
MNTKARVLVVDDSAATSLIVSKLLNQCGFVEVDRAPSGEDAVGLLKQGGYGLVIADVNMTGMNGVQLLAAVRGNAIYHNLCFVLMTAMRDRSLVDAAISYDADGVLLKPFTVSTLKEKLGLIPKLRAA